MLGDRHVVLSNDDDTTPADAKPEETAALGELESVFSAASLPVEFYQEVLHSTSALGVVDASPGQGGDVEGLPFAEAAGAGCVWN